MLTLGKKLSFAFDFVIPHIRRSVQAGRMDAFELSSAEQCALWNLYALGEALGKATRYEECIEVMREQLGRSIERWRVDEGFEESVYHTMFILGNALDNNCEFAEAIEVHRKALEGRRALLEDAWHPDVLASMANLATALARNRQWTEAESLFREELALCRQTEEREEVLLSITNLADCLQEQAAACSDGRESAEAQAKEALPLYREAIVLATAVHDAVWPCILCRLQETQTLMLLRGADVHAERTVRRLVQVLRQNSAGEGFDPFTDGLFHLAGVLQDRGKLKEAEATYRELVVTLCHRPAQSTCANEGYTRLDTALFGHADCATEIALELLSGAERKALLQQALRLYREAMEELVREAGRTSPDTVTYMGRQAEALLELGELKEASSLMVDVWCSWEARVVAKIPIEAIRNHPDTLRLRMCGALIDHALLAEAGESAASRAARALQAVEQQADHLQSLYPAGNMHWLAQWARSAVQRAWDRDRASAPGGNKSEREDER